VSELRYLTRPRRLLCTPRRPNPWHGVCTFDTFPWAFVNVYVGGLLGGSLLGGLLARGCVGNGRRW
jgi:hypothetical protein